MFWRSRQQTDTLNGIAAGLDKLQAAITALQQQPASDPGIESRLDALERSRAIWEAEMEAMLTTAKSDLRNARAAEERARHKLKKAESLGGDEDGDPAFDAWLAAMADRNGQTGSEEGMQPVHQAVGRDAAKQAAKALKWGG